MPGLAHFRKHFNVFYSIWTLLAWATRGDSNDILKLCCSNKKCFINLVLKQMT